MIASMTGYGHAEKTFDNYRVMVEISTVNNRFLDFQIRLPRTLVDLEQKIRNLLSSKIQRGKVNFSMTVDDNTQAIGRLSLNAEIADMYYKILNDLNTRCNLSSKIGLEHFINLPDLITTETSDVDLEQIWSDIEPSCIEALESLYQMRISEGENLYNDFVERLKLLSKAVAEIKHRAGSNVSVYREKLELRIQDILNDYPVDKQRIALEAALAAEKMDITEEVIRLESHVENFEQTLKQDGAVGKRLTFILQEMLREANTIASKASDYQITSLVIDIKDELEKLREQLLNIE